MATWCMQCGDLAGTRAEVVVRIFRINAALYSMYFWLVVAATYRHTCGYLYLFFDQVVADHFLRHAMLHLYTGVHFHEVEVAVLIHQEFYGTHAFVIDGRCSFDGGITHFDTELGSHEGRW